MARSTVALALAPLIGTDVDHRHTPSLPGTGLLYARLDTVIWQVPSTVMLILGAQRA